MSSDDHKIGRRRIMQGALGLGAALAVSPASGILAVPGPSERRFLSLYFSGAWDVLVGLDARDPLASYSGLDTGTDLLPTEYQTPFEVTIGGDTALWGAALAPIAAHVDVATLFRGVNMNTVAHPTGRAYVNSFRPPAGAIVRGDSIGTRMAAATSGSHLLPNVSIGMPSYNDSFPAEYTGARVNRATEMKELLDPLYGGFDANVEALLHAAQNDSSSCVSAARYPGRAPTEVLRASRYKFREVLDANLASQFNLSSPSLKAQYGIINERNGLESGVVAATASKLISSGLCRSVSAVVQTGLDTHFTNWAATQPQKQKQAWTAVAALLDDLRADDPNFDRTTVICHSEFARTPRINGNNGRDHWFANSMIVFGGNLKRGVCGQTNQETLGLLEIDLATGRPQPGGHMLMPEDIGATLAAAAGIDYAAFRVEPLHNWIAGAS